jgi:DHA2 family multidrug resistance protein
MPTAAKVLAFASMCVGMFIALLDIQIVSASLRDIGGGLSAGTDETVWVQTSYLIAEIIVIPMSGWLSRVLSTRWLFCASAVGFTLASLLCGMAWNIQSMIAFRALQGFLGGSMIPMVFTTAFMFFQGKQRVIAAATIGAIASLAPTLGPSVGGWITDSYFLALAVLHQPRAGHLRRRRGADAGQDRPARLVAAAQRRLPGHGAHGAVPRLPGIHAGRRPAPGLVRRPAILTTAWVSGLAGVLFIWRSLSVRAPGRRPCAR